MKFLYLLLILSLFAINDILAKSHSRHKDKLPDSYGRGVGYPWKFGDKFGSLE